METYLITVSPKGVTKNVNYAYVDHVNSYFSLFKYCMEDFKLWPELNSNGNLHWHGYIVIKDKVRWFKKVLPHMKYNCMVRIEKLHGELSKAIEYSKKDEKLMSKVISKKLAVPLDLEFLKTHKPKELNKELDPKPSPLITDYMDIQESEYGQVIDLLIKPNIKI